jgi:hypothetical protein
MHTLSKQMRTIANEKFSPQSDPIFFISLARLDENAEVQDTDRVDGRTALDDFILGHDSI